jgi:hypothetical protein
LGNAGIKEEMNDVESTDAYIDFDDQEIRLARGIAQYKKEDTLIGQLKGLSAPERFIEIRKSLYSGFGNIKGEHISHLIRDDNIYGYPHTERLAEVYVPAFYKFVDQKYEQLLEIPEGEDRESRAMRFAAVVYLLSLTTHHAKDGNNQSSELMALSYIREFCPKYAKSYFPIKYGLEDPKHKKDLGEVYKRGLGTIDETSPILLSGKDSQLLDRLQNISRQEHVLWNKMSEVGYTSDNWRADLNEYVNKLLEEDGGVIAKDQVDNVRFKLDDGNPFDALDLYARYVAQKVSLNNPGYSVGFTGVGTSSESARRNYILEVLLNTDEGQGILSAYIDGGEEAVIQTLDNIASVEGIDRIKKLAGKFLKNVEDDTEIIKQVLNDETARAHERKYQRVIGKID